MVYIRQYLVSPALARLIRKERGTQARVREGYFLSSLERTHFVRLDPPHCFLVMAAPGHDGRPSEEVTEVPLSQAQALLDVAPGRLAYDRTALTLAPGVEAVLEQVLVPRPFDLLSLWFETEPEAKRFQPPLWVGPEVSEDASFGKAAIALQGEPVVGELEISTAALEAVLDLVQSRFTRHAGAAPARSLPAALAYQSRPVDEQLLVGLAQALSPAGEVDKATARQDGSAPPRERRVAG